MLANPLVAHPQGIQFTYINFIACKECGEYEVDMMQPSRVMPEDVEKFTQSIYVHNAGTICCDCFMK